MSAPVVVYRIERRRGQTGEWNGVDLVTTNHDTALFWLAHFRADATIRATGVEFRLVESREVAA